MPTLVDLAIIKVVVLETDKAIYMSHSANKKEMLRAQPANGLKGVMKALGIG